MAPTSALKMPGFPLGPRTWLYTPPLAASGQLVILCTWLGAAPKHISKYTELYQRIAPQARILLVQSDVAILTSSYKKQRAAIGPAATAVLNTMTETSGSERPKILLHAFSNGGTNTATQLLLELRSRRSAPLPLTSLVFDSCPAKGTYWKNYSAMVLSLPRGVATRLFGALAIHSILLLLYFGWIGVLGNENPADLQRRTLLDAKAIEMGKQQSPSELMNSWDGTPNDGAQKPRVVYLYSHADRQVQWTDVRDHAEEARGKGLDVLEVVFEGSDHCAHYPQDADRYAAAAAAGWGAEADLMTRMVEAVAAGVGYDEAVRWSDEEPRMADLALAKL